MNAQTEFKAVWSLPVVAQAKGQRGQRGWQRGQLLTIDKMRVGTNAHSSLRLSETGRCQLSRVDPIEFPIDIGRCRAMTAIRIGLLLGLVWASGCASDRSLTWRSDPICQQFEFYYTRWQKECDWAWISIRSEDYVSLPAFRAIVALDRPALPCLKQKLEQNEGDFFLAYAVAEIKGWKRDDFTAASEQEFRDQVLAKLRTDL